MLPSRPYILTPLATTDERFVDFAPYVPSISSAGVVAFQAARRGGGSGVYTVGHGAPQAVVESGDLIAEVISHPDIDRQGACCFYARTVRTELALFLCGPGHTAVALGAGPLGPTMNDAGMVAFRAATGSRAGIYRSVGASITTIAETGARFAAFHGLPVINARGRVLFRADLASGDQVIALGDGDTEVLVAATGETFSALGAFPAMNDAGVVAFAATIRAGGSGIFAGPPGNVRMLLDDSGPFESFRGALVDGSGGIVYYAAPRGGPLGVYTGPDPQRDRLLSLGAPLLGSPVADFALNPVSINEAGQLAIRVALADARQIIFRADPVGA